MARSSINQTEAREMLKSIIQCQNDSSKSRELSEQNKENKMLSLILTAGATKMEFHAEYLEKKLLRVCVKNATQNRNALHKFIEQNIPLLSEAK